MVTRDIILIVANCINTDETREREKFICTLMYNKISYFKNWNFGSFWNYISHAKLVIPIPIHFSRFFWTYRPPNENWRIIFFIYFYLFLKNAISVRESGHRVIMTLHRFLHFFFVAFFWIQQSNPSSSGCHPRLESPVYTTFF